MNSSMQLNYSFRALFFGSGKRRCLGEPLAKECIFTYTVEILKNFKLHACESALPKTKLLPGITYAPERFKVIFEKI